MIVVTGATGNVGRPLVRALAAAGAPVTAVSRRGGDLPDGVRSVLGDLAEPESLGPALRGAEALFVLTAPDFMVNGDMAQVVKAVREYGISRIVLLSSHGVGTKRHSSHLEDAVRQGGSEWTMLRPGNFDSNALQWADSVHGERKVQAPFGDVAVPAVDPLDIAEVAALVLREPGHAGAIYTLTGPEPISPRQQAAAIGEALSEPVRFDEETRAQARARMLGYLPEPVVEATLDALGTPSAAEQEVAPDVERLLGRPAHPFADWVARHIAAFR